MLEQQQSTLACSKDFYMARREADLLLTGITIFVEPDELKHFFCRTIGWFLSRVYQALFTFVPSLSRKLPPSLAGGPTSLRLNRVNLQ